MIKQFLANVGIVGISNLILLAEKILKFVAVMYVSRGNSVSQYPFTVGIHLDVILVSVMRFIAFLRPTCIGVLLRQLSMNII